MLRRHKALEEKSQENDRLLSVSISVSFHSIHHICQDGNIYLGVIRADNKADREWSELLAGIAALAQGVTTAWTQAQAAAAQTTAPPRPRSSAVARKRRRDDDE